MAFTSSVPGAVWFVTQLAGASVAYNIPLRLRIRGPLDERALRRALDRIVELTK